VPVLREALWQQKPLQYAPEEEAQLCDAKRIEEKS
jgi:hypothetical protein